MSNGTGDQRRGFRGEGWQRPLLFGFLVVAIVVAAIGIGILSLDVSRKIRAQATASSDNVQWSLSQVDVEFLSLGLAIDDARHARTGLEEVRKRFDIFYSRMNTLKSSDVFEDLRSNPDYLDSSERLWAFLDRTVPLIDGPDAEMSAALPALGIETAALRNDTRKIALTGIKVFSILADREREGVARTLRLVAALTVALVLSLVSLVISLLRLDRVNRRNVEKNLMTLARLEAIVTTALDGVIVADRNGVMLEFNPAAETIFGYDRSEAVGAHMADMIIPAHLREAHRIGMERYLSTGERHVIGKGRVRLEAMKKDGTTFPVEVSIARATSDKGEIFVSFLRDLSAQVAAEQELMKARDDALAGEKAKAELLAVMSHEMRTPLNGIMGAIELMQETKLTTRQQRFLTAMNTSAGLLLHHVNGVLSMSRAEAGQLELLTTEVDPAVLLQELVESQRHAIEAHGNRICCDTAAAPDRIWVDQLRLRQVILNLVGNANKFTRNGEIRVECDRVPDLDLVEFRVLDTGIGIAEEHLEQIFDEFRTLDSSYARQAEGTGLGLAISRRLVTAMGGEIGVDSEAGEGSIFWVRLPMGTPVHREERPKKLPEARPVRPVASGAALRVLLVEDNQINRLVAREMLQKFGHRVVEAHDGREGVHLAGLQSYDVILMDISMPDMDGVEATRHIRASDGPNRATPIIALTAHALAEDTRRFLAAGITEALVKPLSIAALQQALAGVTTAPKPEAEPETATVSAAFGFLAESIGAEKAGRLLQSFRSEGEALVQRTGSAEWGGLTDAERADAVHKVAGSAAIMGAVSFRKCLQELEKAYRQGDASAAAQGLRTLPNCWQATAEEIRACSEVQA